MEKQYCRTGKNNGEVSEPKRTEGNRLSKRHGCVSLSPLLYLSVRPSALPKANWPPVGEALGENLASPTWSSLSGLEGAHPASASASEPTRLGTPFAEHTEYILRSTGKASLPTETNPDRRRRDKLGGGLGHETFPRLHVVFLFSRSFQSRQTFWSRKILSDDRYTRSICQNGAVSCILRPETGPIGQHRQAAPMSVCMMTAGRAVSCTERGISATSTPVPPQLDKSGRHRCPQA